MCLSVVHAQFPFDLDQLNWWGVFLCICVVDPPLASLFYNDSIMLIIRLKALSLPHMNTHMACLLIPCLFVSPSCNLHDNYRTQSPHASRIQVFADRSNSIECQAMKGNPAPIISWRLNGENITSQVSPSSLFSFIHSIIIIKIKSVCVCP